MATPRPLERGKSPTPQKPAPTPTPAPVPLAPLFRKIDWLALAITFSVVGVIYFLTLAPELTLEDSGELVTGSFYAGIPHPPGYPVWTIYSWLWTVLVPVGNMAWRVALGEAFLGALACGLIALIVSRGSSMFMEGIEELKVMTGKWETAICIVSGFVAGLLMGLDGFMWKESIAVNRIAVTSVPWFLIVLVCIMRWLYAPHQYRYLCWALFVFGICFTTHQSLIVAAIGVEVAIAAGNQRMGRDVLFGNFVIYMLCYLYYQVTGQQIFSNLSKPGLLLIFHVVGLGSLLSSVWLAIVTKSKGVEIARSLCLLAACCFLELMLLSHDDSSRAIFFGMVGAGSAIGLIYLTWKTRTLGQEWLWVMLLGFLWIAGASFYLYLAVSGMTNPPMQWGYPRTVEGFFHALSRGQYEQPNPTDIITEPGRFLSQVIMLITGVAGEFTWVYMFIALVPFLFFFRMQRREQAWIIGLSVIYLCLGVLLVILLNPTPDRSSADLVKVFFNNSHTVVAALIGYGLALTAAFMATHYQRFRRWGLLGGIVAVVLALYCLYDATAKTFFGPAGEIPLSEFPHWVATAFAKNQLGLPIFGNLVLVAVPLLFVLALVAYRNRAPLLITLALFTAMPLYSVLSHWYDSDQHNHWFGYWFGHDMFTPPFKSADGKPIYPEMTKDAVLFGGTDPGRFCPTYIIFCESFTPHNCQPLEDQHFDRRDVYIITQNALADGTYLNYIRAHYNRSLQIDPPFFSELLRSAKEKELNYKTNLIARLASPLDTLFENLGGRVEEQRRTYTSWFVGNDFIDLPAFAAKLRPSQQQAPLSKYLYENLSAETQQLLSGKGDDLLLRRCLARDLNVLLRRELDVKQRLAAKQQEKNEVDQDIADGNTSESLRRKQQQLAKEIADLSNNGPLYEPQRFKQATISEYLADFIRQNPQSFTRIRLNRLLLEAAYPKEIAKSLGGVYPDREIYIPTPEDSQRCFTDYLQDAQRRLQLNQLKPGEDVHVVENRVQVSGQVAVMAINGLLTKVIFDHNPKNEFFVEESFPLDWMYPYLTPYGVIMKINREPLPELTEDILNRDHQFWKQYSKRFTGDIMDYDTPVKEIADWIERTYLRRNFNGFTGDRKFVYDSDGQKSFSKLRSSIGGIFAWRLGPQCPPEYRPKTPAQFQRVFREADFAFKQAFAFCPYSPEAVFRYAQLLSQFNRIEDALLIAETCLKLDPYNAQVSGLVDNLRSLSKQQTGIEKLKGNLSQLEDEVRKNPRNAQAAFDLASVYFQMQQIDRGTKILDGLLNQPDVDPNTVVGIARAYAQISNLPKLEQALEKLVKVMPSNPEAWYDLAAFKSNVGRTQEALSALNRALELNAKRLQTDSKARDLRAEAREDARFNPMKLLPEFQKMVAPR